MRRDDASHHKDRPKKRTFQAGPNQSAKPIHYFVPLVCDPALTAAAKDLPPLALYSEAAKPVNVPTALFQRHSELASGCMAIMQL